MALPSSFSLRGIGTGPRVFSLFNDTSGFAVTVPGITTAVMFS